jgi:hypothetical protein
MHSSNAGNVLAAQKLESGDICIIVYSYKTKALVEQEEKWTKVAAEWTKVQGRQFTVIARSLRTNRVDTENKQRAPAELQAQNPQLKGKVKFLRVVWKKKTLKDSKLSRPFLIKVIASEDANMLISE